MGIGTFIRPTQTNSLGKNTIRNAHHRTPRPARLPARQTRQHLNKRLWNTVTLDGEVPADEVEEMIDASYGLVVSGMTKAQKAQLQAQTK